MSGVAARSQVRSAMKRRAAEAGEVQSPLARYVLGELQCAACGVRVRSAAAWPAHVASRAHRARLAHLRHQLTEPEPAPAPPPPKRRGILKNAPAPPEPLDEPMEAASPVRLVQIEKAPTQKPIENDEVLPEGFFDDPIMDAKARNIPHKDPIEEEWEKFQKAMKEETSLSAAIIAGEQEEATAERQIDEIEEQIRNLSKVLDLTRKKEEAAKQKKVEENMSLESEDVSTDDEGEFEEYLDWRAKKSYR